MMQLILELQQIDGSFNILAIDMRPDDPAQFPLEVLRKTFGVRNPLGMSYPANKTLGSYPDQDFQRRLVIPPYVQVKESGEVKISSVNARVLDKVAAYDRMILPLKATGGQVEYALSLVNMRFSLPVAKAMATTLTAQERTVIRLLYNGFSNCEVATKLCRSEREIDEILGTIVRKLDARNIVHAIALAMARDIAEVTPLSSALARPFSERLLADLLGRQAAAVVAVDANARLLFANRAAEVILADGGLSLQRGILQAEAVPETTALHEQIADCAMDVFGTCARYAVATRSPGRPPLSLLVTQLPDRCDQAGVAGHAVAVFIADPERMQYPASAQLQRQFGLTRAEAAMALEILKTEGVSAAAERLGITVGTAKSHLVRIFDKTNTRRQAELVRLLLGMSHGIWEESGKRAVGIKKRA
ncbi:LuxR C-terminal-related transcriptional regulator [Methylovirgula sp. 4M-Z18]|uniref:LuxR C-terminal-related transcriptional regulator n=1 Tax=Methylovirgula sp. 4M-Z18 TaxID=2293567 RepID=UPI001314E870|nr:LuxR C-terminal-related transcriptional regulator [Methylovirgula sp. 4M-Z18]